jgi:hypothetical protein
MEGRMNPNEEIEATLTTTACKCGCNEYTIARIGNGDEPSTMEMDGCCKECGREYRFTNIVFSAMEKSKCPVYLDGEPVEHTVNMSLVGSHEDFWNQWIKPSK